jgi:hypothetical protein
MQLIHKHFCKRRNNILSAYIVANEIVVEAKGCLILGGYKSVLCKTSDKLRV